MHEKSVVNFVYIYSLYFSDDYLGDLTLFQLPVQWAKMTLTAPRYLGPWLDEVEMMRL